MENPNISRTFFSIRAVGLYLLLVVSEAILVDSPVPYELI